MGVCYTAILFDEFDWNYVNNSKEATIKKIQESIPSAELLAQWSCFMVLDLDKKYPLMKQTGTVLLEAADAVWYYPDVGAYSLKELSYGDLV